MPQKSLIIFDLDGTLANTGPDLMGTLNRIVAPHGISPMSLETINYVLGQGARAMIERSFDLAGKKLSKELQDKLLEDFLADYAENICVESHLYDGVLEAMNSLESVGFTFSICTNKSESMARLLLQELGVLERFSSLTGGDTFGFRKPDARHLVKTAELAGKTISDAIMIGDSKADIGAARNAAIPSIAVSFGYSDLPVQELGATRIIHEFSKLPDAVKSIVSSVK